MKFFKQFKNGVLAALPPTPEMLAAIERGEFVSDEFLEEVEQLHEEYGGQVFRVLAIDQPLLYVAMAAALIPDEVIKTHIEESLAKRRKNGGEHNE